MFCVSNFNDTFINFAKEEGNKKKKRKLCNAAKI